MAAHLTNTRRAERIRHGTSWAEVLFLAAADNA